MNLMMPDPLEKNAAVAHILSAAPRKKSLWGWLREMVRDLGFRVLLGHTLWLTLAAVGASVGLALLLMAARLPLVSTLVFAASPLMFLLAALVTELSERASGLLELKMTCKYTARQLAAVHTLWLSWLGVLFCGFFSACMVRDGTPEFLNLLALSLCALLLYALLSLFLQRRFRWRFTYTAALWGVVSLAPVVAVHDKWELFLLRLPLWATAALAVLLLILVLWEIGKMISKPRPEVYKSC